MTDYGSRKTAAAAVKLSLTASREEEKELMQQLKKDEIRSAAVDYGGEFVTSFMKIIERAVVAAKREGLILSLIHI